MIPIVLNVSEEEARRLTQRAQESGYETIEAYLRALAEQDMSASDDTDDEEDAATLHADFKEAFKDAIRGKFYTEEEYHRLRSKRE